MIRLDSLLGVGASLAALLAATALLAALWRRHDEASARSLLGVATALLVGSLLHLVVTDPGSAEVVSAVTGREPDGLTRVVPGVATTVWAGGAWSLFAFQYAGRGGTLRRIGAGAVVVLSAAALAAGLDVTVTGGSSVSIQVLTVGYLFTGFLVTAGVFVLLWASVGQNAFPIVEPVLLSGGVVVLLSGSLVAQVFERPALFPALVAVAGVVFLVPVLRYPIFETLPAARVAGRDRVVDELGEGILVTDREGNLRDMNPAAESLLGASRGAVLGDPVTDLLGPRGAPEAVLGAPGPVRIEPDGTTTLAVTGDRVGDRRNRTFGYMLLCADVTDRRIREEQLTLLGRFVVDVVRDRIVEVADEAAAARDDPAGPTGDDPAGPTGDDSAADRVRAAESIWETTTSLATLVARARAVERAIAEDGRRDGASADFRPDVESIVTAAASDCGPEPTVDLPAEPFAPDVPRGAFEVVLRTVLEDVIDGSTTVALAASVDPPEVVVHSGPPAGSRRPLDRTMEGASIDLARLAVELVGGSLSVTAESGDRNRVTIRLPPSSSAGADGRPERDRDGSATTTEGGP